MELIVYLADKYSFSKLHEKVPILKSKYIVENSSNFKKLEAFVFNDKPCVNV